MKETMTYTKQAIEEAVKGGYVIQESYYARPVLFTAVKHTNKYHTVFDLDDTTVIEDESGEEKIVPVTASHQTTSILLDPLFWQSLGKARGWKLKKDLMVSHDTVFMFGNDKCDEWEYKWMCLIHHLSQGGTAETYFEQILTK